MRKTTIVAKLPRSTLDVSIVITFINPLLVILVLRFGIHGVNNMFRSCCRVALDNIFHFHCIADLEVIVLGALLTVSLEVPILPLEITYFKHL